MEILLERMTIMREIYMNSLSTRDLNLLQMSQ